MEDPSRSAIGWKFVYTFEPPLMGKMVRNPKTNRIGRRKIRNANRG